MVTLSRLGFTSDVMCGAWLDDVARSDCLDFDARLDKVSFSLLLSPLTLQMYHPQQQQQKPVDSNAWRITFLMHGQDLGQSDRCGSSVGTLISPLHACHCWLKGE